MKCFVCGGEIHLKTPCSKCKIGYEEMLTKIKHPDIIKLMKKLNEHQINSTDNIYEASLLACELENSSLIFPVYLNEDGIGILNIFDDDRKAFIPVFTDIESFKDFTDEFQPLTNSFDIILKLLGDDTEGIIINVNDECCVIFKEYIDNFFR